jgi:hypothetical protein
MGKLLPIIIGGAGGSCDTSATHVRLIRGLVRGHAFVCSCTARFHPRKAIRCPECQADPQTVSHVLQACPRCCHTSIYCVIVHSSPLSRPACDCTPSFKFMLLCCNCTSPDLVVFYMCVPSRVTLPFHPPCNCMSFSVLFCK